MVTQASDITGLVNTGQLGTMFTDANDAVNVLESTIRISGGSNATTFGGQLGQVAASDTTVSTALESQTRCSYVKSTVLVNEFGNPTTLNRTSIRRSWAPRASSRPPSTRRRTSR